MSEVSHPRRCAPPWWPPPVLTERTGRTGRTSPSGRTGRTHPSGTTGGTGRPGAQAGREEQAPTGTTGGTGPSGSTSRSGRKAPSERTGRTGRTYPSGIASPDEPEGLCIAASGGDAQSSFAIVAFHRVFKQLVVRNFCIVNQVGFFGNTHIEPSLPTP